MTAKNIHAFITRMRSDEAFCERILGIEDVNERLAAIHSEGFDCTEKDFSELGLILSKLTRDRIYEIGCCIDVPYYYVIEE